MKRVCGFMAAVALMMLVAGPFVTRPVSAQSGAQYGDPFTTKDTPDKAGFADQLYILDGGYGRSYDAGSWLARPVRFISDVLAGVPSIVVGRVVKEGIEAKSITWADEATSKQLRTLASKCITSSGDNGSVK